MPKRNSNREILLALLVMVLCGQSEGTTIQPGYNFLDDFEEMKPGQSVVIAVAIGEDTRGGTLGFRESGTRRTLAFQIEKVLWGDPVQGAPILLPNTFVFDGSCWGATVVVGRQWVFPGDRVLLAMSYQPPNETTDQFGVSWPKVIRFLGPGPLTNGTKLFVSVPNTKTPKPSIDPCGQNTSFEDMLKTLSVKKRESIYTLGDILRALPQVDITSGSNK